MSSETSLNKRQQGGRGGTGKEESWDVRWAAEVQRHLERTSSKTQRRTAGVHSMNGGNKRRISNQLGGPVCGGAAITSWRRLIIERGRLERCSGGVRHASLLLTDKFLSSTAPVYCPGVCPFDLFPFAVALRFSSFLCGCGPTGTDNLEGEQQAAEQRWIRAATSQDTDLPSTLQESCVQSGLPWLQLLLGQLFKELLSFLLNKL